MLISIASCPFCGGGVRTPCFATYTDGYKCFSCGVSKTDNKHTFAFRVQALNNNSRVKVPFDHSANPKDWPVHVLQWLAKYYIYDYDQLRRFIYVPLNNSLVFTIIEHNELKFTQERFLETKSFKTNGVKSDGQIILQCEKGTSKTLVFVEDYVSAVRVQRFADVVCLFGTSLMNVDFKSMMQYNDIIVWLDSDEAGQKASNNITVMLKTRLERLRKLYNFQFPNCPIVKALFTDLDPKCLSNSDIFERLRGNL